jgi:hypothetical protein
VLAAAAVALASIGPVGAATAAPSPTPPARPGGAIGLRLLDVPVTRQDDPRARIYIVDHLRPGSVISRRIELTNTTTSTAAVALYAAAASIVDGAFLGTGGRTANDLSTWTNVRPDMPDVPPGGRSTATVTITVPRDAAPGERLGVIWAEARSASAGGVTQVNRVGIRIYLSIGPGGAPAADFTVDSLTASRTADGRPTVVATVHNTGGRALDMSGTLLLRDGPAGLNAGPYDATLGTTLAVDATEPVTINLDELLPAGPWNAQITLRSGLVERSARATITFPAAGAAPTVKTTADRPRWLYPAIAATLLLLLVAATRHLLRRRATATAQRDRQRLA